MWDALGQHQTHLLDDAVGPFLELVTVRTLTPSFLFHSLWCLDQPNYNSFNWSLPVHLPSPLRV
jgi:hypothetical protein